MLFFLFSLTFMLMAATITAQERPMPEKVYAHLDRNCYAAGETIWLKGYVEDAKASGGTSRFLYAELLDADGKTILRSKIRQGRDGFAGYLELPDSLKTGNYLFRAYTRWQLNWPEHTLFHTPIRLVGMDGLMPDSPHTDDALDISFYPEGGRYFAGEPASIGFKAMDAGGKGVTLSGRVVEDNGAEVTQGRTLHDGMGLLTFTPAQGHHYRFLPNDGSAAWNLPEPSTDGATLQIRRIGQQLIVKVINHSGNPCTLWICAGGHNEKAGEVAGTSQSFRIQMQDLAEGLQKFLLTDPAGNILSERAVFRESERTDAVALTVQSEGDSYAPRTLRRVRLKLPAGIDSGDVSVSVVRSAFRPYQQEGGLAAYMQLGSELRGHIENPDYYFNPTVPEKERHNALDLLLMIQGWSYYDFVPKAPMARELTQTLTGEVRGFTQRTPRSYLLSIMAPALNYSEVAEVSRGGRFVIDSLDFRDSTVFVLNVTRDGTLQHYTPRILPDPVAQETGPWAGSWPFGGLRLDPTQAETPVFPDGFFQRDSIQALVIQADYVRIKSPFGSTPRLGAKTRDQLGPYDNMNLLDYVLLMKPNFERVDQDGETIVRAKTSYEYFGDIALCVNGIRYTWDLGQTIMVGDIEKLSITTRDSDAFLLKADGVVLVELSGPGQRSREDQGNTRVFTPLGWQTPRDFYNPRYDRTHPWVPDRRNTIYWNPSLGLWGRHTNSFSFYTDDQPDGPYFLRVEGRAADGRWISTSQVLE